MDAIILHHGIRKSKDERIFALQFEGNLLTEEITHLRLEVWASSIHELNDLADSRSEQISQLQSEVGRHKTRLAALSRDEDLMKYLARARVRILSHYVHNFC
ncbi:hypothetical protein L210DRAFT_3589782, partial [Boletus edulis BED1]